MGRKFAGVSEMLLLEEQEVVCLSVSFDDAFIERIFVLVGVDDGRSTVVQKEEEFRKSAVAKFGATANKGSVCNCCGICCQPFLKQWLCSSLLAV